MLKKAIYPGSFDPFTNGHLDIVKKAAAIFDEVYIVIGINAQKRRTFAGEKMIAAIREVLQDDAGYGEGDFVAAGIGGVPCCQIFNVLFGDFQAIAVAQQTFQYNAEGDRHAADAVKALFRQCG